uniref:Predicted protein n=1 Tax=Hordeum vulgare subsp. vulgare TaxID=112509 RepID=F2E0A6_HORVV|nr:predicted protein [Hordeum vulgare subsp. vulgare]
MVKSTPLLRKRIVKKRTLKFTRFQSDLYGGRLAESWRRPRGIDNRMRRRFRGNKKMPKIGYGSDNATKFFLPNGLKKFVVHNAADLNVLLMNNRTFCAEIAHNVSSRKRAEIVKRAQQIRVKITNSRGKVRTEEKKQEA